MLTIPRFLKFTIPLAFCSMFVANPVPADSGLPSYEQARQE